MPDLVYPYLVEGTAFDAFSLNSRFGAAGAPGFGVNAVMPYAAKRGAFQEVHLPTTGIIAGEAFSDLTVKIDPLTDQFVDVKYVYNSGAPGYPVLSDGAGQDLEVSVPTGIDLDAGMAGAEKVGGVLILANVHFMKCASGTVPRRGPLGFMVGIEFLDGNTATWTKTIRYSERFSNERITQRSSGGSGFAADTPLGDSPFDRPRDGLYVYDEEDVYTFQDIPIRLWLDKDILDAEGLDGSNIQGFRVVGAVVDLGDPQQPIGYQPALPNGGVRAYYREGTLSVIPFHTEIMP